MTTHDVHAAQAQLVEAQEPVTVEAVQRLLGYGSRRQIRRHLNAIARRKTRLGPHASPPWNVDAVTLDAFIAARRAAGYGATPSPTPPALGLDADGATERPAQGRWERLETRILAKSLLDEALLLIKKETK